MWRRLIVRVRCACVLLVTRRVSPPFANPNLWSLCSSTVVFLSPPFDDPPEPGVLAGDGRLSSKFDDSVSLSEYVIHAPARGGSRPPLMAHEDSKVYPI
ncbi:hypothetical protein B0H21DRAFT_740526 [Amylocystis lapponica]|nr:hypothetical protein B0H21DRAFT_740526 [Amylocystis lapponica]